MRFAQYFDVAPLARHLFLTMDSSVIDSPLNSCLSDYEIIGDGH